MTALERAARALYEMGRPASATAEHWNLEWSELGEFGHAKYAEQACAVLMAVREPDEAVFNRANEALFDAGEPVAHETVHVAMIDAILNEKDTTND